MIQPIFVLGTARSGTTWLGNLLADHPLVAAVTHPVHQGIHESHLFSHTAFALPGRMTLGEFVARYQAEDYFQLLDLEDLPDGGEEKAPVARWFRLLMDRFAATRGATHWVEKTPKHCLYIDELVAAFPDARFILIERDFRSVLISHLNKYARAGAPRWIQVLEKIVRYESDMRSLVRFERRHGSRVIRLRYSDLVTDTDGSLAPVLDFLGLPRLSLTSRFPPASSARGGTAPFDTGAIGWAWVVAARFGVRLAPLAILRWARRRRDRRQARVFPKYTKIRS